jgi:prevent-host-death family protein
MEAVMAEFGTFDAKNRLSELLTRAEAGEEISITRYGKVIARIVPAENDKRPVLQWSGFEPCARVCLLTP